MFGIKVSHLDLEHVYHQCDLPTPNRTIEYAVTIHSLITHQA